jgi:hypothetical protein
MDVLNFLLSRSDFGILVIFLSGIRMLRDQNDYSIFGIGVDRKHDARWLFPQGKTTFHGSKKVYVYSENALDPVPCGSLPWCSICFTGFFSTVWWAAKAASFPGSSITS